MNTSPYSEKFLHLSSAISRAAAAREAYADAADAVVSAAEHYETVASAILSPNNVYAPDALRRALRYYSACVAACTAANHKRNVAVAELAITLVTADETSAMDDMVLDT